jgi:integrase/recombinase XerD
VATAEGIAATWLVGYSQRTVSAYMADLRDFAAYCKSVNVADPLDARSTHVAAYKAELEKRGLSAATIARRLSALSGLYEYAESAGVIERSPINGVKRPRPENGNHSATPSLALEELEAFLTAAAAAGPRDDALVSLFVLNGVGISEVCYADASDISAVDGKRTLAITRRGAKVSVPLADRTADALETYLAGRQVGPLLLDNSGRNRLDRHDTARIVRRLSKAAGIAKRISPNSLRHSFPILAFEAGAPLDALEFHLREAALGGTSTGSNGAEADNNGAGADR